MHDDILESVEEAVRAASVLKEKEGLLFIERVVSKMIDCFSNGGKLLIAGNGGSLCDAMHFAEELTGYYRNLRPPLPAIALADPGHLSCVANDTSFEEVFARSIMALATPGDLFIALTTSGSSKNLIRAAEEARRKGVTVIGFLGKTGGQMRDLCDISWIVKGFIYSDRIQEAHMAAIHIIIEMVEKRLFPEVPQAEIGDVYAASIPLWVNDIE